MVWLWFGFLQCCESVFAYPPEYDFTFRFKLGVGGRSRQEREEEVKEVGCHFRSDAGESLSE